MGGALIDLETADFADAARALVVSGVDPLEGALRRSWSALEGCGAMAGSDAGGVAWAGPYDRAAATALNAAADAGNALGQLARMFGQTARNYELADAHSTARLPGAIADPRLDAGTVPAVPAVSLPGCAPASAAGSGSSGGPPGWGLICDAVGYLWPNGSPSRLRHAADAWRSSATALRSAADTVLGAPRAARLHLLPEAPDITGVCQQTSDQLREIGDVHDQLADACLQLADHVDRVHDEVLDELKSLVEWTAGIEAGGAVLSIFSLGTAEVPTQAVEAARIARTADAVAACIQRFVSVAHGLAAAISDVAERVSLVGARLRRLLEVPLLEPVLAGVGPLRVLSETRDLGALGRLEVEATAPTLTRSELLGGHTIEKHVALTDEELMARNIPHASTFSDLQTAESVTAKNIATHRSSVRSWLRGSEKQLKIKSPVDASVGRIYVSATGTFVRPRRVVTVLVKNDNGYHVLTSFLLP